MAEPHPERTKLSKSLRILHLEDDPNDVYLVQASLKEEKIACAVTAVQDRDAFVAALKHDRPDIILSDFSLPTFDGLSALRITLEIAPEVPFIFVSGSLGEDAAILGVRSGARDYVLKQRLTRLGPAVVRAAQEAEDQRQRRLAEESLRRIEEERQQMQKLEALGRLAGGVAHDFNNLLTVIIGYSQVVRERLHPLDPNRRAIVEIEKASQRASDLTRQLLAFGRQQRFQPQVLQLNNLIQDTRAMLERLAGEGIEFECQLAPDAGLIEADPGQVQQILLNLVVNARDAMKERGRLVIETFAVAAVERATGAGPWVAIAVRDTGCGMDEATKSHIFEPFFTTKEVGKGTGLGLATVHGIVSQMNGTIDVDSVLGEGTSFVLHLPQVTEGFHAEAVRPVEESSGTAMLGNETVLVVEDEEEVRAIVAETLRRNGYGVLEAKDGQAAQEVMLLGTSRPDLVLTDVLLPRLSGPELGAWLHLLHPDIPVLYMSGWVDRGSEASGSLPDDAVVLQKPFRPDTLLQAVRLAADSRKNKVA